VLSQLGGLEAAVLVVQHIHSEFVEGFVDWMTRASALPVELARDGQRLRAGTAYVGPGDVHLALGAGSRVELSSEPETLHRPSADVLFSSIAKRARGPKVGVVLTGMGDDGAQGLLELRRKGGITLVQDQASSAVYGMPAAARQAGAASRTVSLGRMARAIDQAIRQQLADAAISGAGS
jgi:two-component system chemotaxis response regulator CheB